MKKQGSEIEDSALVDVAHLLPSQRWNRVLSLLPNTTANAALAAYQKFLGLRIKKVPRNAAAQQCSHRYLRQIARAIRLELEEATRAREWWVERIEIGPVPFGA